MINGISFTSNAGQAVKYAAEHAKLTKSMGSDKQQKGENGLMASLEALKDAVSQLIYDSNPSNPRYVSRQVTGRREITSIPSKEQPIEAEDVTILANVKNDLEEDKIKVSSINRARMGELFPDLFA